MRKNWFFLFLATIFVASVQINANAQQQQKEKYRNKANDPAAKLPYYKKLRWADGLFRDGSYLNAADYYGQLKNEQDRNPYLTYMLGECAWFNRDYVEGAKYYRESYALAPKLYPEAIFKEAMMLKMQGQYDSSIGVFNRFITDNPKTFKKLKKRAQREIDGCKMGAASMNDPIAVNVKNAGPNVNSAYTESAPFPLGDTTLLYSSMNQNAVVEVDKRKRGEYVSRFMTSHKQYFVPDVDSFQWPLKFMDGQFNNPKTHTGNGCFSPGGDRFYFTRCEEEDSMQVICKIYVSKFVKSKWSNPELIGEGVNESGSNTHPYVAKVGKKEILFFASNRKLQSRGGYDIWYSIIDPRSGDYRRPQNAGKQINTEQDEVTPYYDSRVNKLYFASNGLVTMGGFDIFSADGGPSRYTNVSNLGYPINTSADEMYYIKDPVGKPDAYVVSNRIGSIALKNPTCCDDIWRIQVEPQLRVAGKVLNAQTQKLMTDVVVKMTAEDGTVKNINSADGNFTYGTPRGHNYVFVGDKARYSSTRATVNTQDVKRADPDNTANIIIYMDSINNIGTFRVNNIYYEFDRDEITNKSRRSLDSLVDFMKDNPSLTVEIYSFTDAKGDDAYNKDLSFRRAKSVQMYLIKNGISESRMIPKAFGEFKPAAPNDRNGHDYPVGRQLNRRTEFRVVKEDPNRHIIFNSSKPGNINQQNNLKVNEIPDDLEEDKESKAGEPGSRLNK